jgi:predicted P-loop ATPase
MLDHGANNLKPPYHVLDTALDLIGQGLSIFPVALSWEDGKLRKRPIVKDWANAASLDPKQIHDWFGEGKYVIGVPTGEKNDLDVVDVDPRHGGEKWYNEQQTQIPATRRHTTAQGGWHLLFSHHEDMRNSTGLIAPGVDVRGEAGFIVWWAALNLPSTDDPIVAMPDWLAEAAMKNRARRNKGGGDVSLSTRKPPSARAVLELLRRMPNQLETTRDTYVDVNLAVKGCIDALIEADELTPEQESDLEEAAVAWCYRWEGHDGTTDEAAKWAEDWRYRDAKLAGWQTLEKIAGQLIPEYREEQGRAQFANAPPLDEPAKPYRRTPFWKSRLLLTKNGTIKAALVNADIALRYAPEWDGVLGFNQFTNTLHIMKRPPWLAADTEFTPHQLTDVDVIATAVWLQTKQIGVSEAVTASALRKAAEENSCHPVREYLDGLTWDQQPRLDTWLIDHLGAEDTPLNRAYGARFLISAVARVRQPGCKVDTVPILEGRQGLLKSTALRMLASPWFTDHMPDLQSKDAQLQIIGVWFVEFAELGQFGRTDANRAKIFISAQEDRFRQPYGRVVETHPRQCVLAVTLNRAAHGYLKDETGNRRFWPVACGVGWEANRQADIKRLTRERDQLWAEADHRFGQGEVWWLHEPELLVAHDASVADRMDLDPIHGLVADAMTRLVEDGNTSPSFDDVCNQLGLLSAKERTRLVQAQIGRAVTSLGWASQRQMRDGVRKMCYFLP